MEEFTGGALTLFLVGWVIREVISYFKQKALQDDKARMDALEGSIKELKDSFQKHDDDHQVTNEQIKELHEWHDKSDQDGVKIWYVRKSLEDAVQELGKAVNLLAQNSGTQSVILKEMVDLQKEIHREQLLYRERLRNLTDTSD